MRETVAFGLVHNKFFLEQILLHPNFRNGNFNTHFIDIHFGQEIIQKLQPATEEAVIATCLWDWLQRHLSRTLLHHIPSGWRNNPYRWQRATYYFEHDPHLEYAVEYNYISTRDKLTHKFQIKVTRQEVSKSNPKQPTNNFVYPTHEIILFEYSKISLSFSIDGLRHSFHMVTQSSSSSSPKFYAHSVPLGEFILIKQPRLPEVTSDDAIDLGYTAPMPGKILKVLKASGSHVKVGEVILVNTFSFEET